MFYRHYGSDRMSVAPGYDEVLEHAGAVMTTRYGRPVPAHFGSAAGELAACVCSVGVCDRSELSVLAFEGPTEQVSATVIALLGETLAPGCSVLVGGAWWCRETDGRVIVVCGPHDVSRLCGQIRAQAQRSPKLTILDRSQNYVAIGVVGAAAPAVLTALGAYGADGDPSGVPPLAAGRVADSDVLWLLASDRSALVLAPRADAAGVWKAIEDAGRPFGITNVGHEAIDRYRLLDDSRVRYAAAPPR